NYLFDQIVYETKILGHIKNSDITKHPETGEYIIDTSKIVTFFKEAFLDNPSDYAVMARVFKNIYKNDALSLQILNQVKDEIFAFDNTAGYLLDPNIDNILDGTFDNDVITGTNQRDIIFGGAG
ncbi:hypothetical protein, partial [Wohlfahrtiimonas populi]|uniref:hypothetical protein n=1 Tax=Wohlfahrtiimonas populi TaxID=1940240 RepID=UPI0013015EA9